MGNQKNINRYMRFNKKLVKAGFSLKQDECEGLVFIEFFKKMANGLLMEVCYTIKNRKIICMTCSMVIGNGYIEIAVDEGAFWCLVNILDQ